MKNFLNAAGSLLGMLVIIVITVWLTNSNIRFVIKETVKQECLK